MKKEQNFINILKQSKGKKEEETFCLLK